MNFSLPFYIISRKVRFKLSVLRGSEGGRQLHLTCQKAQSRDRCFACLGLEVKGLLGLLELER